jgi:hypothetical protein
MARMIADDYNREPVTKRNIHLPTRLVKKLQHEAVETDRFFRSVLCERLEHSFRTGYAVQPLEGPGLRAKTTTATTTKG